MGKIKSLFLVVVASAVLASCKIGVDIPVYTADIKNAVISQKPFDITIDLYVPIPSKEKCTEYTDKAVKIVSGAFTSIKRNGCIQRSTDAFSVLRVSSQIISMPLDENGNHQPEKFAKRLLAAPNLFTVVAIWTKAGTGIAIASRPDLFASVKKKIEAENIISLDGISAKLIVNNDLAADTQIQPYESFVNGKATINNPTMLIPRRDKMTIQPSDVKQALIFQSTMVVVANILIR